MRCATTVLEDLPELADIGNAELRRKAIEAWAFALSHSSFGRISDIPPGGNPGMNVLKRGSQADHLRGVAQARVADRRHVHRAAAGGAGSTATWCCAARSATTWASATSSIRRTRRAGRTIPRRPASRHLRHTVFGTYVCLAVGLPEEIAHIACAHSLEGQHIGVSSECMIVRHADHAYWSVAGALGLLIPETLRRDPILRVRKLTGELKQAAE